MKHLEGVCMMCRRPLLVHTVSIDGKVRPFCPECEELVDRKTRQAMDKRGRNVKGKKVTFPNAR